MSLFLAEIFRFTVDPLEWAILERIHLGPLAISPHGIGIAIGYLAGAQLMVKRARTRGGPDETDIWNTLFWALLGALLGARLGYVFGHFAEVTNDGNDLLGVFRVWEGGISLLGGISGAVIVATPYMIRKRMGFWRTMDLAAPGLALGIVIGRVGDLIIGDHIGTPTDFFLGWRCLGSGGQPPQPAQVYLDRFDIGEPPALGCYDLVLHQTAIYDFISTFLLLGTLLYLGTRARKPGFMILVFTVWYGTMRMVTDFLRVDRRYFGLTGSQLTALAVGLVCLYLLARYRGAPPRWQRVPTDDGDGPEGSSDGGDTPQMSPDEGASGPPGPEESEDVRSPDGPRRTSESEPESRERASEGGENRVP